MSGTIAQAVAKNFLGEAPVWYKQTIVAFLVLNPILLMACGPFITGWVLILEFIFTLAMALKCYPLQSGGLLALEAVFLGLTTPLAVYMEAKNNFQVILLLMFMVASIYFMKDLLMYTFSRMLLRIRCKIMLSLTFSFMAAVLSAFLDALTVMAVVISVGVGFYAVYHRVASIEGEQEHGDKAIHEAHRADLDQFRDFLRSLLMHAAIGTALGGVCTLVGEPQNLLIAEKAGWQFAEFFIRMVPVTMPVLVSGLITCMVLEKMGWFGYGTKMPVHTREILEGFSAEEDAKQDDKMRARLITQGLAAVWLVIALGFHLAEVGIIGLSVIVLVTSMNGVISEHAIGKSFEEAMPFCALLVVFFGIVAVIHDQHLFKPIMDAVFQMEGSMQISMFYLANGILSMVSDNVFVATVYINEVRAALDNGTLTREQFDLIAVAINTGTNLPSVATPNGQAAFLFLLTSSVAPLVRLSYGKMVIMALPYAIVMTLVGLAAVIYLLPGMTQTLIGMGLI